MVSRVPRRKRALFELTAGCCLLVTCAGHKTGNKSNNQTTNQRTASRPVSKICLLLLCSSQVSFVYSKRQKVLNLCHTTARSNSQHTQAQNIILYLSTSGTYNLINGTLCVFVSRSLCAAFTVFRVHNRHIGV